ncbi:probable U3 small nucleolar RNA-associated protein 11 [Daktulosphaira vitifoliae]|uniref:probable U3 small nucleolar RNA-associated protein 11 n=1 Tax=Daktulosphaira vitifoliae TaxID=58002 RepID=UPI0021AA5961|nr:probable U3 small nucleolar RNA-associated protein 11 [Daktulosphaira vitifoliae]
MSSWKKASKINQKTHRERHQPDVRQKFGLLEKKKDYKVRARHHQERNRVLKLLKKRAQNRNPDEFYFHMVKSKVEDGRHTDIREEDEHTEDQIKLMQTRDLKYINMRATMERKKVERLQSELHFLDDANKVQNNHIFFEDDEKSSANLAEKLKTHPALINRKTNRLRITDLEKIELPDLDEDTIKEMVSVKRKAYRELERRKNREKELAIVQRKLEIKTHLLGSKHEPPKRIKPATKNSAPIYQWKYERKK